MGGAPLSPEEFARLSRLMGSVNNATPKTPDDQESVFMKALDYANRPYSAAVGAIHGAMTGQNPLQNAGNALSGERDYSAYDILVDLGADPDSSKVKLAGTVMDVFPGGVVDPVSYVSLGFNKAGRLARNIDKAGRAAREGRDVLTRAEAVEKAMWGLNLGNKTVPLPFTKIAAKGVDKLQKNVENSRIYGAMGELFGGVQKFAQKFPLYNRFAQTGKLEMTERMGAFQDELTRMKDELESAVGPADAEHIMTSAFRLTEDPELPTRELVRLQQQIQSPTFTATQPHTRAKDAETFAKFSWLSELPDDLAASGEAAGLRHELQSLTPSPNDMPPAYVEMKLSEEWGKILAGEKHPDKLKMHIEHVVPMLDDIQNLYDTRLGAYDPDFKFPIQNYWKHMFPIQSKELPHQIKVTKEQLTQIASRARVEAAAQGLPPDLIEREVAKAVSRFTGYLPKPGDDIMKGAGHQFDHRKHKGTVAELMQEFEEQGVPLAFEERSIYALNAMMRDAERWAYGHDLMSEAVKHHGKSAQQILDDGGNLAGWEPVQFNLPWIAEDKRPWNNMFIPRNLSQLMAKNLDIHKRLFTSPVMNKVVDTLHGLRRWASAWTLSPFPASHMRNMGGDVLKAMQGGTNLLSPQGQDAFLASGHLLGNRLREVKAPTMVGRAVNAVQANIPFQSQDAWKRTYGALQQRFPELTPKKIVDIMKADGIIESGWFRDMDSLNELDAEVLKQANKRMPKLREFIPLRGLFAELKGEPGGALGKSALLRFGYSKGQDIQDFTKGGMWLDRLMEAAKDPNATMQEAVDYASMQTRKYLIDYKDLTPFERDIMKNMAWFYTFTSRNLPVQLEKLVTDPGSFSYLNRAYQGAWHGFEEDVHQEDIPKWLNDNLGLPVRTITDADGIEKVAIWNPAGWVPMSEITELANFFREPVGVGESANTGAQWIIGKLSPWWQEAIEQVMDKDSYTGEQIDNGEMRDLFGVPIPPGTPIRVLHAIRNIRLFTELDRINPFGAWDWVGKDYFKAWTKDRPHRLEAPEAQRYLESLFGWKTPTVNTVEQLQRETRRLQREYNQATHNAQIAAAKGLTMESKAYADTAKRIAREATETAQRLNEVSKMRSQKATREGGLP